MQFTTPRVTTGLCFLAAIIAGWMFLNSFEGGVSAAFRYSTGAIAAISLVAGLFRLAKRS